ncbi:MAG: nucleoside triphosphate pyrophosphohydrolase [Bacteroidota bacterium]|nr:nucleoside triphosphate pyrophosphohydrolase [Bacteroidota bacterium]
MDPRLAAFEKLLNIMDELRAKCPWDKKQTLETLRYLTIEETYELSDAILEKDLGEVKKELGDLLMHIVFYAKVGSEMNAFNMTEIIEGINEKLIRRHPHIYGDVTANTAEAVSQNWEKIKMGEGRTSVLSGVPNSLPAMVKAHRIQEKARGIGFDWEKPSQVWAKVLEEQQEMLDEVHKGTDHSKLEEEFVDYLFALVNYARFVGVNPEYALERGNSKFIRRFQFIEEKAKEDGKLIHEMTLAEMDAYWNQAKVEERS